MRSALLLGAFVATAAPSEAACRLALSLGLDVSSSVDAREYRLQTAGLAAALIAPEVREAFLAEPDRPVMLQIFEWSGWQQQLERLPWTSIESEGDLFGVAAALGGQSRSFEQFPTAIGHALLYGSRTLGQRSDCEKRVLDIAGDGTNNDGLAPEFARRDPALQGITINGLVIGANLETLSRYYHASVIQGPGAFVEMAQDYGGFERAMRRKLLRELGVMEMSAAPAEDRNSDLEDRVDLRDRADQFPAAAEAGRDGEGLARAELGGPVGTGQTDATLQDHAELGLGVGDGQRAGAMLPEARMEAAAGIGEGVPDPLRPGAREQLPGGRF